MMAMRLGFSHVLTCKPTVSYQPICTIVDLLAEETPQFGLEELRGAIDDYAHKHTESLADRVEHLWAPQSLTNPSKVSAYWLKSVRPAQVRAVCLALHPAIAQDTPDASYAAIIAVRNLLSLYKESLPNLVSSAERQNRHGTAALEQSTQNYAFIKQQFELHKDPLSYALRKFDNIDDISTLITDIEITTQHILDDLASKPATPRDRDAHHTLSYLLTRPQIQKI